MSPSTPSCPLQGQCDGEGGVSNEGPRSPTARACETPRPLPGPLLARNREPQLCDTDFLFSPRAHGALPVTSAPGTSPTAQPDSVHLHEAPRGQVPAIRGLVSAEDCVPRARVQPGARWSVSSAQRVPEGAEVNFTVSAQGLGRQAPCRLTRCNYENRTKKAVSTGSAETTCQPGGHLA